MNEVRSITKEQQELLSRPLPAEAVSPHPTKKFLSTIKSIYVTERINEVFGVGKWRTETEVVDKEGKMVVVKLKFSVPDYGIYYECYGGNDNADLGDAYKGATTDALTKVASWMGIGAEVFKDKKKEQQAYVSASYYSKPAPQKAATKARNRITMDMINDNVKCNRLLEHIYNYYVNDGYPQEWDSGERLLKSYDADAEVVEKFTDLFESYRQARLNNR